MEREAPFFLRTRSCRSFVEQLCIAKVPQGPAVLFNGSLMQPPIPSKCYDFPLFLCVFGILLDGQTTSKTYAPNTPKILLKSTSTPPKIDAKTSQDRAQDAPKSRFGGGPLKIRFGARNSPLLGGVLGHPGGVLGASWARLGAVLGVLGRLGSFLGPS